MYARALKAMMAWLGGLMSGSKWLSRCILIFTLHLHCTDWKQSHYYASFLSLVAPPSWHSVVPLVTIKLASWKLGFQWKHVWIVWAYPPLTHWGRVTHICVDKLTNIGSDNGLSPGRRHAIVWTNAGILLIRPLRTNFNEMLIEILTFSFMKTRLKVSSAK